MSKKFTERERTIGWLEENRKHGFFEGQMEEDMDFNQLSDKELQWYYDHWVSADNEDEDEIEVIESELPLGHDLKAIRSTDESQVSVVMGHYQERDDYTTWLYNKNDKSFILGHYNMSFDEAERDFDNR